MKILIATLFLTLPLAAAPLPTHWVGTWATAAVDRPNRPAPNAPPDTPLFAAADTTLREIVHISLGGSAVRLDLSNQFGTEPLTLSAVHLALAGPKDATSKGEIQLPSAAAITFNGRTSVTIPPGAHVLSDPADLKLPAFADLAISIFVPAQPLTHITQHGSAYQTNYMAPGNVVSEKSLPADAKTFSNWFFLKAVDVLAPADTAAVVAFGDSITDGTASTPDTNRRWPDDLARRLAASKKTANLSVLNLGIGGNRVLRDGTGPSALARFDTDVLAQSGVRFLILLESINDIGHSFDLKKPYDPVSAADLIAGLSQLAERAHQHNIKVFGGTLTPYLNANYASPAGEEVRKAVNAFIRTSPLFDGVIDFESATIDKSTGAFLPADDRGDHLHPNDAGLQAMADSINLQLFESSHPESLQSSQNPVNLSEVEEPHVA